MLTNKVHRLRKQKIPGVTLDPAKFYYLSLHLLGTKQDCEYGIMRVNGVITDDFLNKDILNIKSGLFARF